MEYFPSLLTFENGAPVRTAADMDARRPELLEVLKKNAYGDFPPAVPVTAIEIQANAKCCSGNAVLYSYELRCDFGEKAFSFPLRLFMPNAAGKKPT